MTKYDKLRGFHSLCRDTTDNLTQGCARSSLALMLSCHSQPVGPLWGRSTSMLCRGLPEASGNSALTVFRLWSQDSSIRNLLASLKAMGVSSAFQMFLLCISSWIGLCMCSLLHIVGSRVQEIQEMKLSMTWWCWVGGVGLTFALFPGHACHSSLIASGYMSIVGLRQKARPLSSLFAPRCILMQCFL